VDVQLIVDISGSMGDDVGDVPDFKIMGGMTF